MKSTTSPRTALLSVYDKTGIVEFARELVDLDWKILASGGTAKVLSEAGVPVGDVADLVGGGPILGHRVVTLAREVHAGLLARLGNQEDEAEMARLKIPYIDMACIDLYPLAAEIAKPGATAQSVIEQTDIGGPTMLRSAAKGQRIVIARPGTRAKVLEWLKAGEPEPESFRRQLAATAEAVIADYVLSSARYLGEGVYEGAVGRRQSSAKYGENGWQTPAALYNTGAAAAPDPLALSAITRVEGSEPSYNNWADVDRLLQTTTHIAAGFAANFGKAPAIAVGAKHGNACGAAVASSPVEAIQKMVTGDPRAIFGGLIMTNFAITEEVADALLTHGVESGRRLLDGIIAPEFAPAAIEKLGRKGGKCRLLGNPALASLNEGSLDAAPRTRYVRGGFLQQPNYTFIFNLKDKELQTTGELADDQSRDLVLAWAIGSTSNSNTIALVRGGQLIGNGVGQQDRVGGCELAIKRATDAGHDTKGAAAYSDSFFPFPDGPQALIDAGVTAILATSGSVRDGEIQEVCSKQNVILVQLPDSSARGFFGH